MRSKNKITVGILIVVILIAIGGYLYINNANSRQPNTSVNPPSTTVEPKTGVELAKANVDLSNEFMAKKDVTGIQIYEEKGIVYGVIQLKSGVAQSYATALSNELMAQMKVNYAGRQITVLSQSDGKNLATVNSNP
ncbi:hypothetical protein [Dehalobacter sp.]|uniref:hypothetical protein n=1 Tax=Dehalobacter sp. TaxID=1962289 RepID=UPI0025872B08|nr:hypothetical protein [Dehalobacter sp.]MCG1024853.1 hypothetical protein [Dehalobacter sp.]